MPPVSPGTRKTRFSPTCTGSGWPARRSASTGAPRHEVVVGADPWRKPTETHVCDVIEMREPLRPRNRTRQERVQRVPRQQRVPAGLEEFEIRVVREPFDVARRVPVHVAQGAPGCADDRVDPAVPIRQVEAKEDAARAKYTADLVQASTLVAARLANMLEHPDRRDRIEGAVVEGERHRVRRVTHDEPVPVVTERFWSLLLVEGEACGPVARAGEEVGVVAVGGAPIQDA